MSLTCRNVRQLHDAWLDGELSANMNAEVHAHLLQCPECQQQVEMIRASGDVITQDRSEPAVDAEFTSRVLAALPEQRPVAATLPFDSIETRRSRRRRRIRLLLGGSLPAAASIAFFCGVIWPSDRAAAPRKVVAPAVVELAVPDMVDPTVHAVKDAAESWAQINRLLADEASDRLSLRLRNARNAEQANPSDEPSVLDFLLPSFGEMITPARPDPAPDTADSEVVRF